MQFHGHLNMFLKSDVTYVYFDAWSRDNHFCIESSRLCLILPIALRAAVRLKLGLAHHQNVERLKTKELLQVYLRIDKSDFIEFVAQRIQRFFFNAFQYDLIDLVRVELKQLFFNNLILLRQFLKNPTAFAT